MTEPCNGRHDLIVIMGVRGSHPDSMERVRWCRKCGAVVVDIDLDGRTMPGARMSMMLPTSAKPV